MRIARYSLLVFSIAAAPLLVGCTGAPSETQADAGGHDHGHDHGHEHGHDHGHKPKSLHAAVAELTEMSDTIRDAILAGEPSKAHGPLHMIGALLETIPDIASETDLPKAEWDALKAASDEVFDAFMVVDDSFHKGGDKKEAYDSVAEKIEAGVKTIQSKLALSGEKPDDDDHDDHDHDDHDHGDHDHDHDEEDHDHDESDEAAS